MVPKQQERLIGATGHAGAQDVEVQGRTIGGCRQFKLLSEVNIGRLDAFRQADLCV